MNLSRLLPFLFLLADSCITEYHFTAPFQQEIVVEGMITDQPGPYWVKIAASSPVQNQGYEAEMISGASVFIRDDSGDTQKLIERKPGQYATDSAFQAVIGRTYTLAFTTSEGKDYQSTPEKLVPVGDFTNLRFEFSQTESPLANQQVSSKNGFRIFFDSEVLPEQENRVWWRWSGTFEILTYPQFAKKLVTTRTGRNVLIPDPPRCSQYYVSLDTVLVGPFHECECCTCWVTQYPEKPKLSEVRYVKGGNISDVNIAFIEANIRTFYDKYYLDVEQLSLSENVYNFWDGVISQEESGSSLFQTPPRRTEGNVKAVNPDSPKALGYFAASSVKHHSLVMLRRDVPYPLRPIDTLITPCQRAYPHSSTQRPGFW